MVGVAGEFSASLEILNSPPKDKTNNLQNENGKELNNIDVGRGRATKQGNPMSVVDFDMNESYHNQPWIKQDSLEDDLNPKELGADTADIAAGTCGIGIKGQSRKLHNGVIIERYLLDGAAEDTAKEEHNKRSRCQQWMKLKSTLLVVVGSVLYLVMATRDFKWTHELLNVSFLEQEKEPMATSLLGGKKEVATTKVGRADGVRILQLSRIEEVEKKVQERHKQSVLHESSLLEKPEQVQKVGIIAAANQLQRKLQTPEELYYCLCWAELPPEIQDAYSKLGMNEDAWDNGNDTELSLELCDMWWHEVPDEVREAALFIGYNEELWNVDEDGNPISPPEPTAAPVAVANFPMDQPSLKPVANSPTEIPTMEPVADMPTKKPTPEPVTETSTKQPSLNSLSEPTSATLKPTTSSEATLEPTKNPTEGPTRDPSKFPTEKPSFKPVLSPPNFPVSITPASTSPVPAPAQSIQAPIPSTSSEVTSGETALDAPSPEAAAADDNASANYGLIMAKPTPQELYYDEYWKDLPPNIQTAYSVLGVNETIWNKALPSESDDYWWSELPPDMLEAAIFIGYTEELWCITASPTGSPTPAQAAHGSIQSPEVEPAPALPVLPSSSNTTEEASTPALDDAVPMPSPQPVALAADPQVLEPTPLPGSVTANDTGATANAAGFYPSYQKSFKTWLFLFVPMVEYFILG